VAVEPPLEGGALGPEQPCEATATTRTKANTTNQLRDMEKLLVKIEREFLSVVTKLQV
jgi:hypothetical protein